ncbi:hypothetical protein ABZ348_24295 [Streptomyces sp. NPDC005963]|uniref:hypothetical protein n=1 Tax=Streptomyces sp. NPDC005963 TaxID=3156721 RepID=UPI0033E66DE9
MALSSFPRDLLDAQLRPHQTQPVHPVRSALCREVKEPAEFTPTHGRDLPLLAGHRGGAPESRDRTFLAAA